MNNPANTNAFTHALFFESLLEDGPSGADGLTPYWIFAPEGFPDMMYTNKQKPDMFGRDFSFIASGDKAVKFTDSTGEYFGVQQVRNPQGDVSEFYDHALAWILESFRLYGFESKIRYVVYKNGMELDAGYLQCSKPDTDGYTYFACNIMVDFRIDDYERHADTTIDLFSKKNVRNQEITPAPILKFLRLAVPSNSESSLNIEENYANTQSFRGGSDALIYQPINNIVLDDVKNTEYIYQKDLYVSAFATPTEIKESIDKFRIFTAQKKTTSLRFRISQLNLGVSTFPGFVNTEIVIAYGNTPIDDWTRIQLLDTAENDVTIVDGVFEYTIPILEIGQKVWFYFAETCFFPTPSVTPVATSSIGITNTAKINIYANTTALDTIVFGVRYIDAMRQTDKFIRNVGVNAPRFDVGGEFYDQAVFSRALMSQNTSVPFVTTYENCMESTGEVCGDFENKKDKIFVGQFPDFYENVEIGVFKIKGYVSSDSKRDVNPKSTINIIRLGYEKYQDDSNLKQNSIEDPHTEAEWSIGPNEAVSDKIERKFPYIRSAYAAQKAADLEITDPLTADSTDDDVYIVKLVPLSENSFSEYGAILALQIVNDQLTILNRGNDTADNDVSINWMTQGVTVGEQFFITDGANVGTYTVAAITRTLLTLDYSGAAPTETGNQFIRIKFFYFGIDYKTKSNEGYNIIENISNPNQYPNLDFTLRKSLEHWGSLVNTACSFVKNAIVRNTYFKSNGLLKTQSEDGPVFIEGRVLNSDGTYTNEEIPASSFTEKIITPFTENLECYCTYEEALTYMENYKTTRGFVRAYDPNGDLIKGFIRDFTFNIAGDSLVMMLEEKFEPVVLTLVYADGILTVNGTDYDLGGNTDWWTVSGGRFKAYDRDNIPLNNWKLYSEVSLNGVIYGSEGGLIDALSELI